MRPDRIALAALLLVVACDPPTAEEARDAAPDAAPSGATEAAVAEPPIVYPSFDAGGRTEIELPTVRCDDLGQVGWSKVFPPPTWKVKVTKDLLALGDPATRLRAYVGPYSTVLGPPGFHCHGWYGSSGQWLALVPAGVENDPWQKGLTGEVIMLNEFYWATSGRTACARIAARTFPELRGRARSVYAMYPGLAALDGFTTDPYPSATSSSDDRLVSYVDPPGVAGIAREGAWLLPNEDSIHGSVLNWQGLDPGTPAIMVLAVRLRAEREPLIAAIVADFDLRMRTCSMDDDCFGVRALPRCFDGSDNSCP